MAKRATTKNLVEGTPIIVDNRFGRRTGTVAYLSRDYDGRSKRWMVMFTPDGDDVDMLDGAWLSEVSIADKAA